MVGTRAIIPLISKYEEDLVIDASDILQKSLQLYELCLCLMESKNTSVVMQSLETLQQLLKIHSKLNHSKLKSCDFSINNLKSKSKLYDMKVI